MPSSETAEIVRASAGATRFAAVAQSWDSPPVKLLWAPQGEMIAWQKRTGAISVTQGPFSYERELVHAEYGTVTELGDWSPDAQRLVFTRDGHIYTVDVYTDEIRHIADGLHPTWSPDGKEIAFAAVRNDPTQLVPPTMNLDAIRPDGSGRRTIVANVPSVAAIAWRRTRPGSRSSAR